jgi:hypothetical protein
MRCIAFATLGSLVVFEASAQVPTVNIARTCEIAATTLIGLNTAERDRELCLSAEQSALDQLKRTGKRILPKTGRSASNRKSIFRATLSG